MTARSLRPAVTLIGVMRGACRQVPTALLIAAVMLLPGAAATADTGDGAGDDVPAATDDATDAGHGADGVAEHPELALPDNAIPILLDADLGPRPRPLIEWGEPLLGPGKLGKGFRSPTGAIWTPALWVFGSLRTGVNYLDNGDDRDGQPQEILEWASRLDLIANLQLTGTERLVVGFQPLHQDGRFSSYTYRPESDRGWSDELNSQVTTLFFEGEFGQLFPTLDPTDRKRLDIGFAIGRQKIEFQDGIMFNDQIDSIGLTRNSMKFKGISNWRATVLFGWNDIHRDNNIEDEDALVFGVFNEIDTRLSTIEADVAWVTSSSDYGTPGDGLHWGLGSTQRFGFWNTTLRVNGSEALDLASDAVSDGVLVFGQISTTPRGTHDVVYLNLFWGIDRYSSAARDPTAGGPLGQTGLLFAAVGLGRFAPALGNRADDSWGGAVGYQRFWDDERTQLVVEAGGRESTTAYGPGATAVGARLQRKLAQRWLLQLDAYVAWPDGDERRTGVRSELQVSF